MTMQEYSDMSVKSGIAAIVGPPNVGKSTLLNALLGQKISIVTPKPQTTRNRILGIINQPHYQIVLLDTPGLHEARKPLNLEMVKTAMTSLSEVDVILFLVDVSLPLPEKNMRAVSFLEGANCPAILVLNKIDLSDKKNLLPMIETYRNIFPFAAIVPISALFRSGTDSLVDEILSLLPEGPRLYPADIPTDASERFIVAEIIRETIFLLTDEEIPYSTAVLVDSFKEDEQRGMAVIHATIFVEKNSQKGIVIGKRGAKLAQIGKNARQDIEKLLGNRVLLKLWVRVRKNWTKNIQFIRELGL